MQGSTVVLLLLLIVYFSLKVSCMVSFLHAFANKLVFDERLVMEQKRKEDRKERKRQLEL